MSHLGQSDYRSYRKGRRQEALKKILASEYPKGEYLDHDKRDDLAQKFDVNERTIRRDINEIEGEEFGGDEENPRKIVETTEPCPKWYVDPDQPLEDIELFLGNTTYGLLDDGGEFLDEGVTRNLPYFFEHCDECGTPILKFPSLGDPDVGCEILCPECGGIAYYRCFCGRIINPDDNSAVKCRSCKRKWEIENGDVTLQEGGVNPEPPDPIPCLLLCIGAGATTVAALGATGVGEDIAGVVEDAMEELDEDAVLLDCFPFSQFINL